MINISEIVATWPVMDRWRVSPGVDWCEKNSLIRVGKDCWIGENVKIGNHFSVGDYFEAESNFSSESIFYAGDNFKSGAYFRAGFHFRAGNNFRTGHSFRAGDYFYAGDNFHVEHEFTAGADCSVGDNFSAGSDFHTGDWFKAGDNARAIAALGYVDGFTKSLCAVGDVAYIGAGCRWFTLSEAFEHWSDHDQDRRMTLCLLEAARKMAALHGLKEK